MSSIAPLPVADLLRLLTEAAKHTSGFAVVRQLAAVDGPQFDEIEFTIKRETWDTDETFVERAWSQVRSGDSLHWHFQNYQPTLLKITRVTGIEQAVMLELGAHARAGV